MISLLKKITKKKEELHDKKLRKCYMNTEKRLIEPIKKGFTEIMKTTIHGVSNSFGAVAIFGTYILLGPENFSNNYKNNIFINCL